MKMRDLFDFSIPACATEPGFVRTNLLRNFASKKIPYTYAMQLVAGVTFCIGWALNLKSLCIGSIAVAVIEQLIRNHTRTLELELAADASTARSEQQIEWLFLALGVSYAGLSWHAYVSAPLDLIGLLLGVTSPVALFVAAVTASFAPRLCHAIVVGFIFGFSVVLFNAQDLPWPLALTVLGVFTLVTLHVAKETLHDMAALFQTQEGLETARQNADNLAATDSLTGLFNRLAVMTTIDRLVAKSEPFSVLLFDVDLFKNINDSLGHHVGDIVLERIGRTLASLGDQDVYAARLGGDEFAVILHGARAPSTMEALFQDISSRISDLSTSSADIPLVSITAGSAQFPDDGVNRAGVLSAADIGQRAAKLAQRGTHRHYCQELKDAFERESRIAQLLVQSIENLQISVFFQPKVDIRSGRIVGSEALTRFTSKQLSTYPVDEIFSVAEQRGLGVALEDVCLTRIRQEVLQLQRDCALPVSINLSQSIMKLPDRLVATLTEYRDSGVCPRKIRLEVTENAISGRGVESVKQLLETLIELGFSVSLDDFGTGRASMEHLRVLPIHELKIDKSFVREMHQDAKSSGIVRGMLRICQETGLECVVEGVETVEQMEAVSDMGASIGQGYLWSRALTREAFVELVAAFDPKLEQSLIPMRAS